MTEEVIGRVALPPGEEQARYDDGREIQCDDDYIEGAQGEVPRGWETTAKSPRRARAGDADSGVANGGQTVKDDPQPQPPVAFGLSKANPDSWKLLL